MIERILVPLDGSELAEVVLPYVEYLAGRTGAGVQLFTAVAGEAERQEATSYLAAKRDRLREGTVETTLSVTPDGEAEAILAAADAWEADLIAMSTHGRSGVTRWVFGSVADKIIHAERVPPLLVIRARPEKERPATVSIERILVPLDGSQLSLSILPQVEELAKSLGASLVLFSAVIPLDIYPGTEMAPARVGGILDELMSQAQSFLAALEKEVQGRGVKARSVVTIGFPVDEITRVAEEVGAGLIAVATHGRSGVNRWIMGSVADGVVRRSHLPCLMIRPEGVGGEE